MKLVNAIALSLALLCSSAHICAKDPQDNSQQPQQQREPDLLVALINMMTNQPTPNQNAQHTPTFAQLLASTLDFQHTQTNVNTNQNNNQ